VAEPAPSPAGAAGAVQVAIERAVRTLGHATAWIALAIVLLMAANVVLRYLFSVGSVWAQELEWHLLAPLILFGMSYALLEGDHVRVDVLYSRFSARRKALVDLASALLAVVVALIIVGLSIKYVQQAWAIDERSSDPGGLPYRWALKALIPIGFGILALQATAVALGALQRLRQAGRAGA
jgi:TRAP-type mannitol/chloroaromatic compound transport system permease small subunit